jgi:tetratricopeptide (TPR) repeat protein
MKHFWHKWYTKVVDLLPFTLLAIGTAVLPILYLPITRDSINPAKELVLFLLTATAVLAWLLRIILVKEVHLRRTILDIPLVLFAACTGVSFLFSGAQSTSFFGFTHQFVLHVLVIVPALIWTWLLIQEVRTPHRWHMAVIAFLSGGIASLVIFLFGHSVLLQGVFTALGADKIGFNTVSTLNSVFGIYVVCIALISVGLLLKKGTPVWAGVIPAIALFLGVYAMLKIGFTVVWVLFAIGLALLVLFGWLAVDRIRTGILSGVLFLTIGSILLAILGSPASIKMQLPAEVTLGVGTSWNIIQESILEGIKPFLVGSGPGMFVYDFSLHRPALFNTNNIVSGVRFFMPFNTLFALGSEFGLLGMVSFLVLVLVVLGSVVTSWTQLSHNRFQQVARFLAHKEPVSLDGFVLSIAWIVATIGMGVVFYDVTLWWSWWWLLGMSVVGLSVGAQTLIQEKKMTLRLSPQYSLLVSFGLVVVSTVVIIFGAYGVRYYLAETWFTKAQQANVQTSESYIRQALVYRPGYARYRTALAQVYLQQARIETEKETPDEQLLAELLAMAVNQAKLASDTAPYDVHVWDTLAFMYMNARTFAPDANAWAREALERAIALEPSNATLYWRLGNVYEFDEEQEEAEKAYRNAITLRPNYIAAYTSLGDLYEKQENIDDAIVAYQLALEQVPQETGILYHLGRLFYNRGGEGDLDKAEEAWILAVEQKPTYSNALYSLGLLYENKGDMSTAVSYFQQVRELNPDNTDVQLKIRRLLGR